MLVYLTYFKESGKYYSSGEMEVPDGLEPFEVHRVVRLRAADRKLPGLIENHSDYHVYVEIEGDEGPARLIPIQPKKENQS